MLGSGVMSVRFDALSSGTIPRTKTTSATTAIAVIANMTFSASPTPMRCTPMNSA